MIGGKRFLVVAAALALSAPVWTAVAGAQVVAQCTISGTAGNDTLRGTPGNDVICGLGGNDTITGVAGNDTLLGGPGNDVLDGGPGNDVLDGSVGNDRLVGADGSDQLVGGDGSDVLVADAGNDRMDGGPGADTADFSGSTVSVRVNLVDGAASGAGSDTLVGTENAVGGRANDLITGDRAANRLDGGSGDDTVSGGPGNDAVVGGVGNDRLAGNDGADVLDPGSGSNVCQPGDQIVGSCAVDSAGPQISGFSVPAVVRAGDSVTFTWRLVDPAGVQNAGVTVGWSAGLYTGCGFGQSATLVSGTATDGRWSYTCTFPTDAVATEYSAQVSTTDNFGNWSASEWGYFRIDGPNSDADPPRYSDVRTVGPARVGELLTITWTATDASGVDGGIMWVAGPGGYGFVDAAQRPYAEYVAVDRRCNVPRTSCTFTQTVRLSSSAAPGQWLLWISTTDVHANKVFEPAFPLTVLGPAEATSPTSSSTTSSTTAPAGTGPASGPPAVGGQIRTG